MGPTRSKSLAKLLPATAVASVLVLLTGASFQARGSENLFPQKQKVPPLPQNLTWLNTAGPLELHDLRGKFVLLDFWTYCCINCMHVLPELHKLEQTWPKNVVVIGVHSAKFMTEQQTDDIRAAIQRYKIEHPVINDARHELWELLNVHAWPTAILIDPEGYAIWGTSGEFTFEQVDKVIRTKLPYYRQKKLLDETPLRFATEGRAAAATPLRFPSKILADEASGRLFIADSNHNRIVVAKLDGTLLDVIGSGVTGRNDGDFSAAQFNQPQGMALRGNQLFVADTENHEIRRVDLAQQKVTTIAGTGLQSREPAAPNRWTDPHRTALSSPWDLLLHGADLYIAMAGCHQIWKMRLDGASIGLYAGNGVEDIVDGAMLPPQALRLGAASFAQPSGLAGDGKWLYVADSEGSSIRAVPLGRRADVRTVVGTSQRPSARLFTFGDLDGAAGFARFQHPLGVAWYAGQIFVADTYNHKIRVVDLKDGTTRTLAGTGLAGHADQPAAFFEPGGLAVAEGKLFVADTNNHLIRTLDLATRQVATLTIAGLKPPTPPQNTVKWPAKNFERLPLAVVRAENGTVRLHVEIDLPAGYKINSLAPLEYRLENAGQSAADPAGVIVRDGFGKTVQIEKPAADFEIRLPVRGASGRDTAAITIDYYYCREGAEGLCKVGSVAWIVPLELSTAAESSVVHLRHQAR
jgi:sugar lactone lactonase YvrE/thiol-disulfide isomerase/thioredoxin